MLQSVAVFCGSSSGSRPEYGAAARSVGTLLARVGVTLIYGGSNLGLMGILADACLQENGTVVGVMPRSLVDKELAHSGLSELHIVDTMHQRKALMADRARAFIALPGGFGTWDEFCEMLTWSQLGIQSKACGVLNVCGYYDPLLALADRAVSEGFLPKAHRDLILHDTDPESLLKRLECSHPPEVEKWLRRGNR